LPGSLLKHVPIAFQYLRSPGLLGRYLRGALTYHFRLHGGICRELGCAREMVGRASLIGFGTIQ
jgi:hypothetical protein